MCGITGIISKDGSDVSEKIEQMLSTIKHKGQNVCGLLIGEKIHTGFTFEELNYDERSHMAMGHTRIAVANESQQLIQDRHKRFTLLHNGEIYNHRELQKELKDRGVNTRTVSETIAHLLEEAYDSDLESAVSEVLPQLDGTYALAVSDGEEFVIARDVIGVKQLYIGENEDYIGFASERKALWELGISDEERLLPGHLAKLSAKGVTVKSVLEPLVDQKNSVSDPQEAIESYGEALVESVKKRVDGFEKVGVIFSGGIDSVLIAKIASFFADVTCYTAGIEGSMDLEQARSAASEMGMDIKIKELDVKDIEDYTPKVMGAIEDRLFLQIEAGIPVYAALEMAQKDGQKVVLSGQGPDELFGGYPWYRKVIAQDGYEKLEQHMLDDLQHAHCETLEREVKMAEVNGLSFRYPYVDPQIIKLALQIDTKLKIRSSEDKLGKYVHREFAKQVDVPVDLADRPKEAAQHGSGVHEAILKTAKRNGFTEDVVKETGYNSEKSIREKLGSSIRYGYKYGGKKLWKTPDHLQLYLDMISLQKELISESELKYAKEKLV
ncbi:MAG: asparagine synthetase B [Archaeoglobaceae archaeon]